MSSIFIGVALLIHMDMPWWAWLLFLAACMFDIWMVQR